MFNYSSIREIQELLAKHNLRMRKRFGQNFMVQESLRLRFVKELPSNLLSSAQERGERPIIWEIGPGIGAITKLLLEMGFRVRCFEIDKGFVRCLQELFQEHLQSGNLFIVEGDVLDTIFSQIDAAPCAIIGNLPYTIATNLITRILARWNCPMVFTFQNEVVERICASPNTASYGTLSILCQFAMQCKNCGKIMPAAFFPIPRVTSAIVRLVPHENSMDTPSPDRIQELEALLRIFFHARRKTIANNIRHSLQSAEEFIALLEQIGIAPSLRSEVLSVQDFRRILKAMSEANGQFSV